jgi:hypothetical protein
LEWINIIFFDLDGVLRRLELAAFGHEVDSWHAVNADDQDLIAIVNANPELCLAAPPSEYLDVVNNKLDNITILTNQLPSWQPWTDLWLEQYLEIPYKVLYTRGITTKLEQLGTNDKIIEDYPLFPCYDKVALITRPYNVKLNVPVRINNVEQFKAFLEVNNDRRI